MIKNFTKTIYNVIKKQKKINLNQFRFRFILVGRDGFEPSKTKVDGFTVRCIWPLCNLPKWSWWSELNQQPSDYKSDALPLRHTSIYRY